MAVVLTPIHEPNDSHSWTKWLPFRGQMTPTLEPNDSHSEAKWRAVFLFLLMNTVQEDDSSNHCTDKGEGSISRHGYRLVVGVLMLRGPQVCVLTVAAERPGPLWATMAPEMALIQLCMSSGLSDCDRERYIVILFFNKNYIYIYFDTFKISTQNTFLDTKKYCIHRPWENNLNL